LETAKAQAETRLQSALAERDAAVQARQAAEASASALQQQLQVRTEVKTSRILSRTDLMHELCVARWGCFPAELNAAYVCQG